jgi:hypothetical protein
LLPVNLQSVLHEYEETISKLKATEAELHENKTKLAETEGKKSINTDSD